MSNLTNTQTYTALVRDIAELYNRARHALVEAYWQIGKRIVEQEQQGGGAAPRAGLISLILRSDEVGSWIHSDCVFSSSLPIFLPSFLCVSVPSMRLIL